jgi:putative FmdB family regulatory protein
MPLYEYRCLKCRKRFSKLLAIAQRDEPQPAPLVARRSRSGSSRVWRACARKIRCSTTSPTAWSSRATPDDPQTMRRFMREMSAAMDEDPYEMEEIFEEELAAESAGDDE